MAVDALQQNRMVGDGGTECFVVGEGVLGPAGLVPAAAEDPAAGRRSRRALARPRDDLVEVARAGEVEAPQRAPEAEEVGVAVDEAGEEAGARRQIDASCRGSDERRDVTLVADGDDAPAADRDRVRDRPRRVERPHERRRDDDVRGRRVVPRFR